MKYKFYVVFYQKGYRKSFMVRKGYFNHELDYTLYLYSYMSRYVRRYNRHRICKKTDKRNDCVRVEVHIYEDNV